MRNIIIATKNKKKSTELKLIIEAEGYKVLDLNDLGITDEIEENGKSLHQNALIKARYLFNLTGDLALGEDSGLEVDALNGEPGVYSARYAGVEKNDQQNIQKLLEKLSREHDRKAQFRTVIALVSRDKEIFFEGIVRGQITVAPMGDGGFGYDPVFVPEGFQQTFAELPMETKNSISHRSIAVGKLLDYLKKPENR
jgi:XTP/dITP diphosphohydrolase